MFQAAVTTWYRAQKVRECIINSGIENKNRMRTCAVNSQVLCRRHHHHHHHVRMVEPGETHHKQDALHSSTDQIVQSHQSLYLSPLACVGDAEK